MIWVVIFSNYAIIIRPDLVPPPNNNILQLAHITQLRCVGSETKRRMEGEQVSWPVFVYFTYIVALNNHNPGWSQERTCVHYTSVSNTNRYGLKRVHTHHTSCTNHFLK